MTGGWKYAAASVIGTSHLASEIPICQDSCLCEYIDRLGVMLCVVSDGAGSASHSEIGSQTACELIKRAVENHEKQEIHSENFALRTLDSVQTALEQISNELGIGIRDLACTLLVAIVGTEQATFWQIGDGAICFRLAGEQSFNYAFWPAKGEYANVTEFVTDSDAQSELRFDGREMRVADLAVFSDGLERLALDFKTGEVFGPFFDGLFPYLHRREPGHLIDISERISDFLSSARMNHRTDDDKTLILASLESLSAS